MPTEPLDVAAYHEAGHVVAARSLGVEIKSATLSLATTRHLNDMDAEARRKGALISFSGPMAEARHGCYTDEQCAELWCSPAWGSDLLNALRHLDSSGGGPCAPVLRSARRLVRRNWRSIKKVAAALIERGELSGDAIDELIGWDTLTGDAIDRLIVRASDGCEVW
jgi:hypothetical protein